jgi:hypothetical protein
MLRVVLKLFRADAVEKIVQAHLLCAINPLPRRVDLAIRLPCRDNRARGHVHFGCPLEDPLQRRADVAVALFKQSNRVRVPVDAGSVCQPVFFGDGCRGTPANERGFDFLSLAVGAH